MTDSNKPISPLCQRMIEDITMRKLPVILSIEKVTCLIESAGGLKYKAALSIAYGAGLRASTRLVLRITASHTD